MTIIIRRYPDHMKFYSFFHILLVIFCIIIYLVACFVCFYLILYITYWYCYVYVLLLLLCSDLGIVFHCVVLRIFCV